MHRPEIDPKVQKKVVDYSLLINQPYYFETGRWARVKGFDSHAPESYLWVALFTQDGGTVKDTFTGLQAKLKMATSNVRRQFDERHLLACRLLNEFKVEASPEALSHLTNEIYRLTVIGHSEIDSIDAAFIRGAWRDENVAAAFRGELLVPLLDLIQLQASKVR